MSAVTPLWPPELASVGSDNFADSASGDISHLIERQAAVSPTAIALRWADGGLRFDELDSRVNRFAQALRRRGVRSGTRVAILLPRSHQTVIAILAVLRLGGAYVPLDPAAPSARLKHILLETEAALIVGDAALAATAQLDSELYPLLDPLREAAAIAAMSELPLIADAGPDAAFCVLYTSGSTGIPKGVELTQRNVLNCLQWMQGRYRFSAADRVLHKTPLTFDVSMYELFWPLIAGATIVIADPEGHRDAGYLAELIHREGITAAHFVPSMLAAFLEEPDTADCAALTQVFAAGEALTPPLVGRFFQRLPQASLHNLYGPTEAGVVSHWTCERDDVRGVVPIGHAVSGCSLQVLDDEQHCVAAGEEGELYIGGLQLARGYLQRPELTAERFIQHAALGRLYRSGDRVRQLPDGALEYRGRRDHQVKLRGIRVELGEIETRLAEYPGVVEAVAGVREIVDGAGASEPRLVAWLRPREAAGDSGFDLAALRHYLEQRLPEAMVPQYLVVLKELPHLPNGKIDRKALPQPAAGRPPIAGTALAPRDELERRLAAIWEQALGFSGVGVEDRFFGLGGTSLLALQVMARLRGQLGLRVPVTRFFAAPTIALFADMLRRDYGRETSGWLSGMAPTAPVVRQQPSDTPANARQPALKREDIAIVGMACRVPGADDVDQFWDQIIQGREGIRDLSDEELAAAGVPAALIADPAYVKRAGTLREAYSFDAAFFGMSPREAELTDPQQRALLECAWHALEHAGLAAGGGERTGVYAGLAHNHYYNRSIAPRPDLRDDSGFQALIGADKDYAATRIAFKLNLRGPALTLQTACSSSGVALHLACQGLLNGDCDSAVVGGVRINVPDTAGYASIDGGPQSGDGRVRPFDARASGMVLSSGVACVVLKPLSKALEDGDRVYAVIKGTAINNDGADKMAYTAPSESGQVNVIRAALAAAGVTPDTIGYVETHGTGTLLGDPVEVAALAQAFEAAERIAIGSVKGNIGHLDAGAGAVGLIKTALALHHRRLPPSIHCEAPNPECDFERTPLFVNTQALFWPADGPRRAGLSSFGFGGTNFHGVLEEAPPQVSTPARRPYQLLRLSAKTDRDLRAQAQQLAQFLAARPDTPLADVAYTLDVGRARLDSRSFVVAQDLRQAVERLSGVLPTAAAGSVKPNLVLMFPGQGAQHVDMGRELYQQEPAFRAVIDACADLLAPLLGLDLRRVLYPGPGERETAAEMLRSTQLAQPAIFAVSYATAKLWESWGVHADVMVGHSLGEFVAATLAGVFELEHALAITAARGRLMQQMPGGGMLALRLSPEQAQPYLRDGVALAGINSPNLIVLSGPHEALAAIDSELKLQGVLSSPLHTSHAFHSSMMEDSVQPFADIVAQYPLRAPKRPIISTLTGGWVSPEEMLQPLYWARQMREAVRFAPAIETLLQTPGRVFLEAGPGQNLSTSVRQTIRPEHQASAIASLPHAGSEAMALEHLLRAAGRLYSLGIELDARRFYGDEQRLKVGLPGYPFARKRYFLPPIAFAAAATETATPAAIIAGHPANDAQSAPAVEPAAGASPVLNTLLRLLSRLTGTDYTPAQYEQSFLELGMDSLVLTQVAGRLKAEFKVELRFRKLLEDLTSIRLLAAYLEQQGSTAAPTPVVKTASVVPAEAPMQSAANALAPATFGAGARISRNPGDELSLPQRQSLAALSARYIARTGKSKAYAQQHRATLADPRTVSGFRPLIKELIYPIVVDRSDGAYLWDLDGNRYVDATCGFGSVFFGHKAGFVADAIAQQLAQGWEIGPQTPLAGECAKLFTACVGLDRVAFCNTGSEAVLAAVRLARTVTGRNLIVSFAGDYHGIQDEVIVRAGSNLRSLPAAPGIPAESVANTLILEYGSPKSLEIIRERGGDIAGVLIEPVQSRRPDFRPREFLHELRTLCTDSGIACIMDEVITGFRAGLGGAQAYYGVKADIATYGKVFGGGVPVGAIAGIDKFMDALDGGQWQYGDDSVPEAGVTYFAGTFVRHPLTMAAVRACLLQLKTHPHWPFEVAQKTARMVDTINADLRRIGLPLHLARFASLWKPHWETEQAHGDLLFFFLRERGIHLWEGRPCFLTMAHQDEDCQQIITAFRYAAQQMLAGGFVERVDAAAVDARHWLSSAADWRSPYVPPVPGARIGRDTDGNPAWFVADPARAGRYLQLATEQPGTGR